MLYPEYDLANTTLVVANAASDDFWIAYPGPYNLVFSTDVFEHIPPADLTTLLARLHNALAPDGVVITRPTIFTGITGGHDPAWYPHKVDTNPSDGAWGHLREPSFAVDTYLNRLTRREYVGLFEAAGFEILQDEALHPRFGYQHLEAARRAGLDNRYDEYELFSNTVEFVLKRRSE